MPARFTPRQLNAFLAVAEFQNFRLASVRLNLTPSAVSSLIAELEATLGFALFDRTTRKVALTAEGRRFLPAAEAVGRQMEQAATVADEIRAGAIEIVRIAAPLVVAAILLPRLIASRPRPTDIGICVIDTPVVWLTDRVAIGEADLAIGPDRECPPHIRRTPLFPTPWHLWLRPDQPLAAQESIPWSALQTLKLVAAGRDHEHSVWPQLAHVGAPLPENVQIVEHITTSLGLAAGPLGPTFAPDYVEPLAQALGLVGRPLVEPDVGRHLCLYERADWRSSRAIKDIADHIVMSTVT